MGAMKELDLEIQEWFSDSLTSLERRAKFENGRWRSAWSKGICDYARDLVECLHVKYKTTPDRVLECVEKPSKFNDLVLNGAKNWKAYSWGGGALIYDWEIASRLCTPSELRRKIWKHRPNGREDWLDVQARALSQAAALLARDWSDFFKKYQ